jgi:hypothetical protein
MMWLACYISLTTDEDPGRMQQQQHGSMAVFMTIFLVCCIEAVIVKIVTTEEDTVPRLGSMLLSAGEEEDHDD